MVTFAKNLILILAAVFILPLVADCQTTTLVRNNGDYKVYELGPDTTYGADTLTYTLWNEYSSNWQYSIQYVNDSIGGGTAGTVKHYVSNDPDGAVYYVKNTVTLNGATQQNAIWEGTFAYPKAYIEKITSGTDTSIFRAWFVIKKD